MVTLVLTYYEAPRMLDEHLRAFETYPQGVRVVVVDDGSPKAPADMTGCAIPYELWRMTEDRPWHQDAARNVAMLRSHGTTLATDIDHLLSSKDARALCDMQCPVGFAYRPRRIRPDGKTTRNRHCNSFVIDSADYWRAGGYNEDYCGYYGTDGLFRRQLHQSGIAIAETDSFSLTLYEGIIDDATTDLPRGNSIHDPRRYPEVQRQLMLSGVPDKTQVLQFAYEFVDGSTKISGDI